MVGGRGEEVEESKEKGEERRRIKEEGGGRRRGLRTEDMLQV